MCLTLPGLAALGTPFQFSFNMSAQMWVSRAERREKCSRYHHFARYRGQKDRESALGTIVGRHQPEMSESPAIYVHITG